MNLRTALKMCDPLLIGFVLGLITYAFFDKAHRDTFSSIISKTEVHELNNEFSFINPLLQCEGGEMLQNTTGNFKRVVEDYISQINDKGQVSSVAVYYRNLNNGPWFGIDEREKFLPASLLKVPLLISFLDLVEKNPALSEEKILFSESLIPYYVMFSPRERLQKNTEYPLRELAERMIIYSDNDAALLLSKRIGSEKVLEVYKDFGMEMRSDTTDFMTVREYASFFRVLYNASYLSKSFSEAALSLLAETDFDEGLVAGVPSNIKVSHKFGERILEGGNLKQLHDCGIVYFPNNPYLLCIMTRGEDMISLLDVIKNISRIVYEEVEKQSKE